MTPRATFLWSVVVLVPGLRHKCRYALVGDHDRRRAAVDKVVRDQLPGQRRAAPDLQPAAVPCPQLSHRADRVVGRQQHRADQVRSSWLSVRDATYLGIALMRSANGSPARRGQAAAIACHVRRPNSSASVLAMTSSITEPIASGSK